MSKIVWDAVGERFYETGVDHGVLYPQNSEGKYPKGVAWNGLTGITESPSGAEATDLYADNIKYATMRSAEDFGFTIEAYTYPDEFASCDGSAEVVKGVKIGQQERTGFGMCYRTQVGNDTATSSDDGYKLHIIYGATASPSEKGYTTINDSPEAISFSWECKSNPVVVDDTHKPSSTIVINSLDVDKTKLKELEDILYGTEDADPRLPLPAEIIEIFTDVEPAMEPPIENLG